ncbi:MAG: NAD+ synthase [Gemmatimonadales bacterium]|nr:NAD+ synthase [Gemmatimonadales bacterium]MDZ4389974.1 NAD+ synthase [Gemmatimonadales bacterium]
MSTLTVALCQFRPSKGRVMENMDRVEAVFAAVAAAPTVPDVVIFPEAILTGYFLEGGVLEHACRAEDLHQRLAERHARSGAPPLDVCLGFYELHDDHLYNSAIWTSLGGQDAGIRHVHRKLFLPTYGVFDEQRFVEAGREIHAFDTRHGRMAMVVCEDAWHSLVPTIAALDGAQFLAVVAASPARGLAPDPANPCQPESLGRWERVARSIATEHGLFVALTQLVGFEGGKGFPGGSLLAGPTGEVLARAPIFEDSVVQHTIELGELARVRAGSPMLADLREKLPHLVRALEQTGSPPQTDVRPSRSAASPARIAADVPPPAVSGMEIDAELARRWLVEFLRDELTRRRGFAKAIVGLSGGVDSAVVAWLAAEALGPESVIAVRMPYRTSSPDSLAHARLVTEALGIEERTVDITAAVDGYAAACGMPPTPDRLGNVMARTRMITLFDLSAACGALPLGTGNKSERLLGYFTWHADDTPPINPIGDLFKTQVWALARHLGVPEAIVNKRASADLIEGQSDEDDFGVSYATADGILDLLLRGYREPAILAAGFSAEQIALVRGRLDNTHWKRRPPSVAMVSQTAVGEYYLRPVDY